MADLIASLATRTGIDPGTIRTALGALLTFLKGQLGPEACERLQAAVPGAAEMMAAFETGPKADGPGLLGTVANLAGNLLGGRAGDASKLLGMLSRAGLDADQAQAFLPRALEHLQGALPPDVQEKVRALIPALDPSAEGASR
jgi:hypothetical protein